jgi:hypothetical protein
VELSAPLPLPSAAQYPRTTIFPCCRTAWPARLRRDALSWPLLYATQRTSGYPTVENMDRSSPGVCAAVGRAQRSKDAEKLCIVHAVLLLAQHGVAMHDSADAYDDFVSVALASTGVVIPHSVWSPQSIPLERLLSARPRAVRLR